MWCEGEGLVLGRGYGVRERVWCEGEGLVLGRGCGVIGIMVSGDSAECP